MNRDGVPYGLGAIALGVIGLVFGDFALQWQPVPKDLPGHYALALVSATVMLVLGLGVLWSRTARPAAAALAVVYLGWVALHGPDTAAAPGSVASWLGVAETLSMSAGGLALFAGLAQPPDDRLRLAARLIYGLCPLVFGLSHFAYADFTAKMVPGWIPHPLFWAYATGTCHLAAGLAILFGVAPRLAATLLTTMMGCFVVMLHIPRVMAAPDSHLEWTMTAIALSLTGAAWALRQSLPTPEPSGALAFDRVGLDRQG
ncbi:DoxX family membrane protein [Caulobacter soli]|uniref:DoxX family membrane protein n=1 Tax=Caulobacter soli TaxID=2708539 RepID=UPI0013EA6F32|nr:DoxX family protein [Caulobacter soli]